jgi:hypothetical protein
MSLRAVKEHNIHPSIHPLRGIKRARQPAAGAIGAHKVQRVKKKRKKKQNLQLDRKMMFCCC